MEYDKYNRSVEPVVSFDKRSDAASIQQEMEPVQSDDIKVAISILKSNGSNTDSLRLLSSQNGNEVIKNATPTPKSSKKNVTFPESIVAGYHAPPVPWNNVSECSTEDLIAAYKKSCLKHDIKPLPKLLQQLHAVVNFHERNETLTFRGESLNIRQCETFEEILRRVQFRTIDLEASHLDEESAIAMFDMIEYYHSATRINISYNKIGIRGWQACSRMLKKTHCVEHLDARSCSLTEQMVPVFGRALRLGSMLKVLHLENSIMSGRSLMILVAAMKMNEILEDLFLADNKLMPSDGIQLGNLLKFNHRLRLLDVRNNHLGDVGTTHMSEGLFEQNLDTGLQTLVLWNNQVTCQSMNALSRALKTNKNLETLNLGHNNITNEGIHRLKEGLLQNKSLLRIGLQAAKIYCEGAVALAECVAESPILIRLDLRENDIKTAGLMALSLALKVNLSVHRIDVDQNAKRESCFNYSHISSLIVHLVMEKLQHSLSQVTNIDQHITSAFIRWSRCKFFIKNIKKGIKDYAEQQRRLLQDINTYSQRNREAAARQEQEEKQKKMEEELQAALNECQPDVDETSETQASSAESTDIQQNETEESLAKPAQESLDQQQMRLQLNLPLFSRSQSLDSPAEPPQIEEKPPLTVPSTVREQQEPVARQVQDEESPLPAEFPPSPMVSSEGKTIHADTSACPAIPLLMEPSPPVAGIPGELFASETSIKVKDEASSGEQPQPPPQQANNTSLSPSHDTFAGGTMTQLKPSTTPSPTKSPTFRHKFIISRVMEHSSDSDGDTSGNSTTTATDHILSDSVTSLRNQLSGDTSGSVTVTDHEPVTSSCDSVGFRSVTDKIDKENEVPEFIESLINNIMNVAYSTLTGNVETCENETKIDNVLLSSPKVENNDSPTGNMICGEKIDVAIPGRASLHSDSQTSDNDAIDSSDGAIGCAEAVCEPNRQLEPNRVSESSMVSEVSSKSETNRILEVRDSKSVSGSNTSDSGEKVVNADSTVNVMNGINVSVEDFLEMCESSQKTSGGDCKDIEGMNEDLLSRADDFEKELDDMLASVQTGLAFTSPGAVQTDNST